MSEMISADCGAIVEAEVTVNNDLGLHARPAAKLVNLAQGFTSEIKIYNKNVEADAKSILGILSLSAVCGSVLTLRCKGMDAKEASVALVSFFNSAMEIS